MEKQAEAFFGTTPLIDFFSEAFYCWDEWKSDSLANTELVIWQENLTNRDVTQDFRNPSFGENSSYWCGDMTSNLRITIKCLDKISYFFLIEVFS